MGSVGRPNTPVVLSPSRWAEAVVAGTFGACAYAVAGGGINGGAEWLAFCGSALLAVIGVASLIVHPRLEIGSTTIIDVRLLSRTTFDLRRCGPFRTRTFMGRGGRSVVAFDYEDARPRINLGHGNRRQRVPTSRVEVHGHDPEAVAALLNEARTRARLG